MRRLLLAGAVLVAATVVALLPLPAAAHALRQSSVPADGATLQASPATVSVTFGEEPDAGLSRIEVLDTSGQAYQQGAAMPAPGDPRTLVVAVRHLPRGVYTVSWRTVSRIDGHTAAGTFAFGVGVNAEEVAASGSGGTPASFSGDSPRPSAMAVAGRWALYAGLLLLIGAASVAVLVFASAPRATLRLLPAGWLVAAAGTVLVVVAQARDAGVGLGDLAGSSLGRHALERAIPLAAGGLALLVALARTGAVRRWSVAAAGMAAAAAMLVDVLLGHAAAGSDPLLNTLLQWVHITAVGVWLGGLGALLAGIRGTPGAEKGRAVRRFSAAAGIALGVVAGTGIVRAAVEIGSWGRVTSTTFGQLVLLKLLLVAVLAALGALNRYRHVGASSRVLTGLRRVGGTELAVGSLAVLVTAALVNVTPPVSVAAAPGSQQASQVLTVNGSDSATTVRLRLDISPGIAGFNRFTATVVDYDTRQPVAADSVSLRFSLQGARSVGESELALKPQGQGTWSASGANLSLDGTWTVTALVARGAASVEVPLTVTPRVPPQQVTVSRVPGEPTLYTVHLSAGRTVQVYLDPDRPGSDILHATFFDASGNELPLPTATMSVTPPGGGAPESLSVHQLEPGHFVGDLTAVAGTYRVDITGTAGDGTTLTAHLTLTPGK